MNIIALTECSNVLAIASGTKVQLAADIGQCLTRSGVILVLAGMSFAPARRQLGS
jgi:hypothetical protein